MAFQNDDEYPQDMDASEQALIPTIEKKTSQKEIRPLTMLIILTFMFHLLYVDRGTISSNSVNGEGRSKENPEGSGFMGAFDLSKSEDGVINSLFTVGILIGSPIFSQAVRFYNPLRLIGVGFTIWAIAVAGSGLSRGFYTMVFSRLFTGFGEAAILSIGPAFIDDKAPAGKVTLWLSILYMSIPNGFALGVVYAEVIETFFGWRAVLLIEAALAVPFIMFCFFAAAIPINRSTDDVSYRTQSHLKTLWNDLKVILSHPVYSITMFGNIFQRGVMVALTYWGPRAAESMFDRTDIDYWIGGLVLSSGILGSILSGWIVDKMGASIPNALKAGYLTCIANAVFLTPTFLFIQSFYASLFPFFIVFVTMFMQTPALTPITLWSVPTHLRPTAVSTMTVLTYVFGETPTTSVFGAAMDSIQNHGVDEATAFRWMFGFAGAVILFAALIFFIAQQVGKRSTDYRVLMTEGMLNSTAQEILASGEIGHLE